MDSYFQETFTRTILPLYPKKVDQTDRIDFIQNKCITIDPEGCEDADDGFSILHDTSKKTPSIILQIHIADPTVYFNKDDRIFKQIIERGQSYYPSGEAPIHMMPNWLVHQSSLMDGHKLALSVIINISPKTFLPIKKIQIKTSIVNCEPKYRFTYQEAVQSDLPEIQLGLKIADALSKKRKTIGKHLSDLNRTTVATDRQTKRARFNTNSTEISKMKDMIAEFAILANTSVATFLLQSGIGGIFRSCDATLLNKSEKNATNIITDIVKNGVTAEYIDKAESHDLVGSSSYCHFTSPIRRATDVIAHILVKSILDKNPNPPFTEEELTKLSAQLNGLSKQSRNLQFKDKKWRALQAISHLVTQNGKCTLTLTEISWSGRFYNLMITGVDHYPTNISLSYKLKEPPITPIPKKLIITKVNKCSNPKFCIGILPELDELFI